MNSLKQETEVVVVGGGPKGLVMQYELEEAGIDSILVEATSCGRTWDKDHVNKKMPITPADLEISNSKKAGFQKYLDRLSPAKLRRNPLIDGIYPTAGHIRDYSKDLKRRINQLISGCEVRDMTYKNPGFRLNTNCGTVEASSVVLATGLIGYGERQFSVDPTGLMGKTDKVQHQPSTLREDKAVKRWLEETESLAVIGAGPAAYTSLMTLKNIGFEGSIHVIEKGNARDRLTGKVGAPSDQFRVLAERFFPQIQNSGLNIQYHDYTTIQAGEFSDEGVSLKLGETGGQSLEVDRVLLCTGYAYNFGELPFVQSLLAEPGVIVEDRHPVLNESHQVTTQGGSINLYVLGAGASSLGHDQTTLASTPSAVSKIIKAIIRS